MRVYARRESRAWLHPPLSVYSGADAVWRGYKQHFVLDFAWLCLSHPVLEGQTAERRFNLMHPALEAVKRKGVETYVVLEPSDLPSSLLSSTVLARGLVPTNIIRPKPMLGMNLLCRRRLWPGLFLMARIGSLVLFGDYRLCAQICRKITASTADRISRGFLNGYGRRWTRGGKSWHSDGSNTSREEDFGGDRHAGPAAAGEVVEEVSNIKCRK